MNSKLFLFTILVALTPSFSWSLVVSPGRHFGVAVTELYGTMSCAINQSTTSEGSISANGATNAQFILSRSQEFTGKGDSYECKVQDDGGECFGWTIYFWEQDQNGYQRQIAPPLKSICCGTTCHHYSVRSYVGDFIYFLNEARGTRQSRAMGPSYFPPSPMAVERMH